METIKNIYKIGPGPSSSHTIAPYNAAKDFLKHINYDFDYIVIDLFGSLSLTGKGHGTDLILKKAFDSYETKINFHNTFENIEHPNTLDFSTYKNDKLIERKRYYSIGGGDFSTTLSKKDVKDVYPFKTFDGLKNYMKVQKIDDIKCVIDNFEDDDIDEFLKDIFLKMCLEVELNLKKEGFLPGRLHLKRIAKDLFDKAQNIDDEIEKITMLITSFAYSASEGNASGEIIVTAPTCGACAVLPSILYYFYKYKNVPVSKIIDGLKVAGIIGDIIKNNASISGAMHGCQAEIGSACSMTSAFICYINDLSLYQIEYGAEIALEHFLGLTCDPVDGYVQIPCIERNGIAALRALTTYLYAKDISNLRRNVVSLDGVINAMKITGESLSKEYKETSIGGLAKILK